MSQRKITDNDILAWLAGRCFRIDIAPHGADEYDPEFDELSEPKDLLWHFTDGVSIADAVVAYCERKNIDLLEEIKS